ncbi:hypothetical protein, variant 2 [Aphanomyces astaci]|uniref:Alpha-ketoglutarate-dependent dioxygenase AlkB-like domain-containing protein n=1 Tax=Aphanomyces astaci TaxID=112090 RepID=W4FHP9_APHAT|nr:hypothetical protein, variant 2 [Aphanomyces astaci]ETV66351.1 hypothetical protein, variant 2 [Aphanomyces astaci]|eukprot:XP_009844126.1 hypothetical protein, variant 2 [Aphanomyces astaci]
MHFMRYITSQSNNSIPVGATDMHNCFGQVRHMRGLVSRGFAAVGRGGRCHRSTGFKRAFSTSFSWQDSPLVDRSMCKDAALVWNDLQVMQDVLTLDEERLLADEAAALLRRRRYEVNHWDQVIVNFKEMETVKWSQEAADILARVRTLPILPQDLEYFPPVHVIDLAEAGYIKPHVDSIKVQCSRCIIADDPDVVFRSSCGRTQFALPRRHALRRRARGQPHRPSLAPPVVLLHAWRRSLSIHT